MTVAELDDRMDGIAMIRPRPFRLLLGVLGAMMFVAIGASLTIWYWTDPRIIFVGPLAVSFFGWAAFVGIKRLTSGWAMSVGPAGFTIPGPTYRPKWITWAEVEHIGAFNIGRQDFTGVRLKTYANLITQFSDEEARVLIRPK